MTKLFTNPLLAGLALCLTGCGSNEVAPAQFRLLRKDATGLDFRNDPRMTSELNPFNYLYFFNGGGIAAADFNNDGLTDLFFSANTGDNKLYLNEGNLRFRDVTDQAGVASPGGWKTGVSVADLNNDGLPDLYLNRVGGYLGIEGRNELYLCTGVENGVPKYREAAAEYGLDLVGFCTQSLFFDYDLDGDLDLFQLNHSVHQNETYGPRASFTQPHPTAGDRLLRNTGGKYEDVTVQAGILSTAIGYGLGIVAGDANLDGWPDLYVANDFHENDYLYLNRQNGTFEEVLTQAIGHSSRFSMGVDMADFNNDGRNDIFSLDMMPCDPAILKSAVGEDSYDVTKIKAAYGYAPQQARNALQLWARKDFPNYQEIASFAGVMATDWSWATFFFDFDNDGWKDLFVSNGIRRRLNDLDYINFLANNELHWRRDNADYLEADDLRVVEKMPQIKLPNRFFKNTGNLHFEDIGKFIEGDLPTYSNGAVFADFDNDGDPDVAVNNLEDEAFLYENTQSSRASGKHNYLKIQLKGARLNQDAIGTKVIVFKGRQRLLYEHFPVRGFQSASLGELHIGVGDTADVDSVMVVWPDLSWQRLNSFRYNRQLALNWQAGLPKFDFSQFHRKLETRFVFEDVRAAAGLNFTHTEDDFVDFDRERLLPFSLAAEGPALAVGDANGDGFEDVFLGNAQGKPGALFFQKMDGSFDNVTPTALLADDYFEDVDATFADLDGDGDLDLAVAAGGNEYAPPHETLQQRWYRNNGKGSFQRIDFQGVSLNAACVLPADFDGDGLRDVFFGARAIPGQYGRSPASMLLRNKGNGVFEDVTEARCKDLRKPGLVKNAAWSDLDNDGDADLALALEWDAITVFFNEKSQFRKERLSARSTQSAVGSGQSPVLGFWNFVLPYDFDEDGDFDLLAGNLGSNVRFQPTLQEPVKLYVGDFDNNGQTEPVLTYYLGGREITLAAYPDLVKQMPILKKRFLFAKDFANASVSMLLGKAAYEKAVVRQVTELRSFYFENAGKGQFKAHPLPVEFQLTPLKTASLADLDGDGKPEVLPGGNFYNAAPEIGRFDAGFSYALRIGKAGKMEVLPLSSNLFSKGQIRQMKTLKSRNETHLIVARNNETVVLSKIRRRL
jgi:hypothetical protein